MAGPIPPPGRVWVTPIGGGDVVSIPESQLTEAVAAGVYEPASDERVQLGQHKADADAHPLSSAAEGLVNTVTLGGASYLDRNVFGLSPEELQGVQAMQESGAGQVGSGVGLGIGLLGGSGLARGALAGLKYAPIAGAQRLATGLGTAVQEAAAARGAGAIGSRVLGLGVEGAVEGSVLGVANSVTEQSLGDEDLAAEKIIASVKENALLGLGVGAFGGGIIGAGAKLGSAGASLARSAGSRLGGLTDDAAAALARRADGLDGPQGAGETGGLVPQSWNDNLAKVQAIASGGDEDFIRKAGVTALGKESDEIRRAAINKPQNIERYTREVRAAADEMQDAGVTVRSVFAGDLKREAVARLVKRSPETLTAAQAAANNLQETVAATVKANRRGFTKTDLQDLNSITEGLTKRVASSADEADVFIALDSARRDLFDYAKKAGKSAEQGGGPGVKRGLESTSQALREAAESTRLFLQDESTWGAAAAAQTRRNAAGTKFFGTVSDFDRHIFTRSGEPISPEEFWITKRPADPQKISGYLRRMNDVEADLSNEQIVGSLQARRELLDTIIDAGDVVGDDLAVVQRARDATIRTQGLLREASEKIGYADALEAQIRAEGQSGGAALGGVLGGMTGGPIGAIIGAGLGLATKPGAMIKRMATMQSLADRMGGTDNKILTGVKRFIGTATERYQLTSATAPKRLAMGSSGPRTRPRGGAVAAAVAAENILGRSPEAQRTRYNQRVKRIRELVADPESSISQIHESLLKGIAEPAPGLSMALAAQHRRGVEFLHSKIPLEESAQTLQIQGHLTADSVTQRDIDRFAKYLKAYDDPVSLISDLANRDLTPEAIETVKVVYPKLFGEMRLQVMTHMAQTKERISHGDVIQLSVLFEFPGHPTMEPAFVERQQARMAQAAPEPEPPASQEPPRGQPINVELAKNTLTHAEQVSARL